MISLSGMPLHIEHLIIGKIVKKNSLDLRSKKNILVTDNPDEISDNYEAIVFWGDPLAIKSDQSILCLAAEDKIKKDIVLNENDIVAIYPNGELLLLYRMGWKDVTLFFTNQCNSRCIMCPQISNIEDKGNFLDFNKQLLDLLPDEVEHIGITGGEPTVFKDDLINLISHIHDRYPEISISLLTNGRAFKDESFVKKIKEIGHRRILFCIPLYAANHEQHDKIVGQKGAFQETIKGLYNLYRLHLLIEIRIVVFKYNYQWLKDFSEFVYRNLPFVRHIAFMGMEYTGNAAADMDNFWIDPFAYKAQLHHAVWFLHQRNMNVSIYNIPLCLLEVKSWVFARDSISAWKKIYLPICDGCAMKEQCSGVFFTSERQSNFITAVTKQELRGRNYGA